VKITDETALKILEKELVDSVVSDLNWEAIEQVFKDEHNLVLQDDVEYKNGDLVVHNDQLAYKFDFEVKVMLSVVLYRDGNYLLIKTPVNPIEDVPAPSEEEAPEIETEANEQADMDVEDPGDPEMKPIIIPEPEEEVPAEQMAGPDMEGIERIDEEPAPEENMEADAQAQSLLEADSIDASDPVTSPPDQKPEDALLEPTENPEPEEKSVDSPAAEANTKSMGISEQITTEIEVEPNLNIVDASLIEEAIAELTQEDCIVIPDKATP